jgi:hypothetical protein
MTSDVIIVALIALVERIAQGANTVLPERSSKSIGDRDSGNRATKANPETYQTRTSGGDEEERQSKSIDSK